MIEKMDFLGFERNLRVGMGAPKGGTPVGRMTVPRPKRPSRGASPEEGVVWLALTSRGENHGHLGPDRRKTFL